MRREQYRITDNEENRDNIARDFIFGKIYNCKIVLQRVKRDHPISVDVDQIDKVISYLHEQLCSIENLVGSSIIGIEGNAAAAYFSVFNQMILREKEYFAFKGRNRRPPRDAIKALLSYTYMLLTSMCANALETIGLDSYVRLLHRDRPGRTSLALDLMEELRPCMADRFVLTLINNRIITKDDFIILENGSVIINDEARITILKSWQERKQQELIHPYLKEKLKWGLIPYVEAQLLAKRIRGELNRYTPFLWR